MSYIRAEEVLPKELIEAIQQYVCGKSIYIPCVEKEQWGSRTNTRQYYEDRNREIFAMYRQGTDVATLASRYALSEKSIRRILRTIGREAPTDA